MHCPNCKETITSHLCRNCGYDLAKCNWIIVAKLHPPNDIIIESLLKSYQIPFRLIRREVSQFPVSIGPLSEVGIAVPEIVADEIKEALRTDTDSL
ncbi:MAG: hypothetical protein ACOXZ5_09395 [Syntrophomonadaceae bacterium]|jgi:hypothetical protein